VWKRHDEQHAVCRGGWNAGPRYWRRFRVDAATCAALIVLAAFVFRKITRLWWMFDDPFLLNILKNANVAAVFRDANIYPSWTPLFNPFLLLSLKLDLMAFGPDARSFYMHQLAAFVLIPPMLYLLLRLWCSRVAAAVATVVFTIAGPTLDVVPMLMLRHYVEGAFFAIAAAMTYVIALRRQSWMLSVVSACLYFLAVGGKEIYAPLPLLLAVIPEGTVRRRLTSLIPHAIAASTYAIWRIVVLGPGFGPYGFVVRPHNRLWMLATLPFRAVRHFAGSGSVAGFVLLALVVGCATIVAVRVCAARLPIVTAIGVALVPILPVATQLNPRWTFVLWLLAASAVAFVDHALPPRSALPILVIVLLAAIVANRVEWPREIRRFTRMSDEARVFANLGPDDIIRDAASPPVTLDELARLVGGHGRAMYDDLALCANNRPIARVFQYDESQHEVRDVGKYDIRASCRSIRSMPFVAHVTFEEAGSFFWDLGPYRDGSYAFVLGDGKQAYDVPREGGFRSPNLPRLAIRVRYRSPAGWTTYSPQFYVDMRKRQPIMFERR
jgi:hypothetical protein